MGKQTLDQLIASLRRKIDLADRLGQAERAQRHRRDLRIALGVKARVAELRRGVATRDREV